MIISCISLVKSYDVIRFGVKYRAKVGMVFRIKLRRPISIQWRGTECGYTVWM